jgi:hypothetical protein
MVLRKTADRGEYTSASESRQLLPGAFVAFLALSIIATLLIGLARRPLKPSLGL